MFGTVTGGFLLLATLGFALVSRVERFLNIAHAELISLAALMTWWLTVEKDLPFLVGAAVAVAVTAVTALVVARLFYRPLLDRSPAILLITSIGVVFLLHGILEAVFSPGIRSFDLPLNRSWDLGGVRLHPYQLTVILVALASVGLLHLLFTRTSIGTSIRALADNPELAKVRGVDVDRVSAYVWLLSGALAGMAGVALGVLGTITTDIGFQQILLIVSVAILAGLGSIYAVATSAFLLGLMMDISGEWISSGYRSAVAFAVIIVVLTVRPQGLSRELVA